MPSLPIPLISALVLMFLLARAWMTGGRRAAPLVLLLAVCAAQGVIIALAQHYHVRGFAKVQPITATLIPPLAWVAFQVTAVRAFRRTDLWHLAWPLAAILCLAVQPETLNLLIPGLFFGYGAAILWTGRKGADATPRMRLEAGDLPGQIWEGIGAVLILSAPSDLLIVAAREAGAPQLIPWIITVFSGAMLLIIGVLSLSSSLVPTLMDEPDLPEKQISDQDLQIVDQLNAMMRDKRLYLDPDLTLSQLSRRMLVPAKQLSAAINRVTGENVSRYINAARIAAAQDLLRQGQSITNAMLASGFNTKSNFNREFLRVSGQSPSDWLAGQGQA